MYRIKIKRGILLLLIQLLVFASCENNMQTLKQTNSEYLNNKGFSFLQEYLMYDDEESLLDSALFYFNEALKVDENNVAAYHNRKVVLSIQGNYNEKIDILKKELEKVDPNDNATLAVLYGELCKTYYEQGDTMLGDQMKNKSKHCFNLGLKNNQNTNLVIEYVFFLAFTESKEKALNELEKYKVYFQKTDIYNDIKQYILLSN